jgi:hypothetical protein
MQYFSRGPEHAISHTGKPVELRAVLARWRIKITNRLPFRKSQSVEEEAALR